MKNGLFIRDALDTDIDGVVACGKRFFEYAGFDGMGLPFDEQSFRELVKNHIENGIVLLLMDGLSVAGGIAGIIRPWGLNKHINICSELFYWVDMQYRGRSSVELLRAYEKSVKESGANQTIMVAVNTHLQCKVENLYERSGYRELERSYIKAV